MAALATNILGKNDINNMSKLSSGGHINKRYRIEDVKEKKYSVKVYHKNKRKEINYTW